MDREQRERLQASRELGQAYRIVQAIRMLYFLIAGLFLLAVVQGLVEGTDPETLIVVGIFLGFALLAIYGAGRVRESPGPWSVGMAVVITLMVSGMGVTGVISAVHKIWGTAIVIALWCVLPLAFRAKRLMERNPDLYITQKFQGRRPSAQRTERGRRIAAETRRQKAASRNKAILFFGAFVLCAAGVIVIPPMLKEPVTEPPFGSRADDFRQAWNRADWVAVVEFMHATDRARRWPRIKRLMRKRGWNDKPPKLEPPRLERDGPIAAHYGIVGLDEDVEFIVYWAWDADGWWWDNTKWPKADRVKR